MSALRRLEQQFQECVLARRDDIQAAVVGTARANAAERVGVYVEGYRLRLLETLENNFPGLRALLGDDAFDELGRAYIDAHPSTHPSVRWFGQELASLLRSMAIHGQRPELAEMAEFELCQADAFDAADAPLITIEDLARLPPPAWAALRFALHPSVRLLALRWNVPPVWQATDQERDPPALVCAGEPVTWLIWRQELNTHWRSLADDEAWALAAVRAGSNFAELCEGLCQWHEESAVAPQAASLLKRWVSDGVISALLPE